MTTVVYDGRYLAADSRATNRLHVTEQYKCAHCEEPLHGVADDSTKLMTYSATRQFKYQDQVILAAARWGSQPATTFLRHLLEVEMKTEMILRMMAPLKVNLSGGLLLLAEKHIHILTWNGTLFKTKQFDRQATHAQGSGAGAAKLMLKMGRDMAPTAVAAAAMADKGTGGDILVLDTHATGEAFKVNTFPMRSPAEVKMSLRDVLNQTTFPKETHEQRNHLPAVEARSSSQAPDSQGPNAQPA